MCQVIAGRLDTDRLLCVSFVCCVSTKHNLGRLLGFGGTVADVWSLFERFRILYLGGYQRKQTSENVITHVFNSIQQEERGIAEPGSSSVTSSFWSQLVQEF